MNHGFSRLRRLGVAGLLAGAALIPALVVGTAYAAGPFSGAVYTQTNASAGNSVVVYNRTSTGTLSPAGSVSTGGAGTGSGLGSQGAVILSDNGAWLFAVNAGSNSITSFAVQPNGGLQWADTVSSGGTTPISLTFRNGLLYVLNAGTPNISGFTVSKSGLLTSIAGSTEPLSASASSPEDIAFNPAGTVLAVTEKGSGLIDTYVVSGGVAGPPISNSYGNTAPYAIAYTPSGVAIVVDAATGSSSSYTVNPDGTFSAISSEVPDFHLAPCWVVVTGNGKYEYTANAHDNTISSYTIGTTGSLTLLNTISAGSVGPDLDLALSSNSHFLYVSEGGAIAGFTVGNDGSLSSLGFSVTGGQGLAAS
jgi:6-phosphogluconolactonase (cycloisomerase 2 family)